MKPIVIVALLLCSFAANSQTLYVPGSVGNNTVNQNVGIGTGAAPEYKLDVYSAANDGKQFRIKSSDSPLMKFSGAYSSGDGAELWQNASGSFFINTNSQFNAISITNNGNVGINKLAAGKKLEVNTIVNGDGIKIGGGSAAAESSTNLYFYPSSSSLSNRNWVLSTYYHNIGDFVIRSGSGSGVDPYTSGITRFAISRDGRVGIGSPSPQYQLEIESTTDDYKQLRVKSPGAPLIKLSGSYNGGNGAEFFQQPNGDILINANDAKNVITIKPDGNVAIGSYNPGSFKLAVSGKIWSQEVNVAMNIPGPDYVFEKDYNLLPLSELETYINKNKHLPEVPSAKEMEANGLNLREMNLILLKKVEELTLHLIEMKKEVTRQQQEIDKLKK
jgi:hypothetical protein